MQFKKSLKVQNTDTQEKLCDKVCQWLAEGQWFSPVTPVSTTNKTDRHDIAVILLKVALNTLKIIFVCNSIKEMFERSKYLYTEEGYHCESLSSELTREFRIWEFLCCLLPSELTREFRIWEFLCCLLPSELTRDFRIRHQTTRT
jgi:hypothetical protein